MKNTNNSVKKYQLYGILLLSLLLSCNVNAKVSHYVGGYALVGEWSMLPTGSKYGNSLGAAGGLGVLYELQSALELFNAMLKEENEKLTNELDTYKEELDISSSKVSALSEKLDKSEEELVESRKRLDVIREDCAGLKDQLEENKNTISSLRKQLEDKNFIISDLNDDLNLLNDKLNSQNNNNYSNNDGFVANNDSNGEFISNEQFTSTSSAYSFDDYVELQKEYISLLKKYERSQEDLYNEKVKVIHYKNLLDKFKSFILRIQ